MYREIAGTDERVRAIPGVPDRRVRATKVRLYLVNKTYLLNKLLIKFVPGILSTKMVLGISF